MERSGQPLWLEADGEIRGVLLPAHEARRLMGGCVAHGGTTGGVHDPGLEATTPRHLCCLLDDSLAES